MKFMNEFLNNRLLERLLNPLDETETGVLSNEQPVRQLRSPDESIKFDILPNTIFNDNGNFSFSIETDVVTKKFLLLEINDSLPDSSKFMTIESTLLSHLRQIINAVIIDNIENITIDFRNITVVSIDWGDNEDTTIIINGNFRRR